MLTKELVVGYFKPGPNTPFNIETDDFYIGDGALWLIRENEKEFTQIADLSSMISKDKSYQYDPSTGIIYELIPEEY